LVFTKSVDLTKMPKISYVYIEEQTITPLECSIIKNGIILGGMNNGHGQRTDLDPQRRDQER